MKKYILLMLCANLTAQMPLRACQNAPTSHPYSTTLPQDLIILAPLVVVPMCFYGVKKAVDFFNEANNRQKQLSNQELIDQAVSALQDGEKYNPLLIAYRQACQSNDTDPFGETLIHELAMFFLSNNLDIGALCFHEDKLCRLSLDLDRAEEKLSQSGSCLSATMYNIRKTIDKNRIMLNQLITFCTRHIVGDSRFVGYGYLLKLENKIRKKYVLELQAIPLLFGDQDHRLEALHLYMKNNSLKPFGTPGYAKQLLCNINRLKHLRLRHDKQNKFSSHRCYPFRIASIGSLISQLQHIHDLIIASPLYHKLLAQEKSAQREKIRQQLEKERIAIEKIQRSIA